MPYIGNFSFVCVCVAGIVHKYLAFRIHVGMMKILCSNFILCQLMTVNKKKCSYEKSFAFLTVIIIKQILCIATEALMMHVIEINVIQARTDMVLQNWVSVLHSHMPLVWKMEMFIYPKPKENCSLGHWYAKPLPIK